MSENVPAQQAEETEQESPLLRLGLDFGPLLIFFVVNWLGGLFWATGVFMVVTVIALAISRIVTGKIATMPLVTAGFVMVFGGLTLYLQNETFIKVKPTIIYMLFAGALLIGHMMGRAPLKILLGQAFELTETGWRTLTFRWAGFFVALAVLNEFVWRNVSNDSWVTFKVFGLLPITLIFAMLQIRLIQRHTITETQPDD